MEKDLTTIDDLKEELPIRWAQEEPAEFLQKFVAKLQYLNQLLSQNSYVRGTSKVLNYIIKDATSNTMVLLAGMTGTGKTHLINALLRRPIMSPKIEVTTAVNSIICYGEKEEVRAHFLDGQIASFDIYKVELFTSLNTSSAKILREGLDFIEIFVRNDLLKMVTLIDTTPLQLSGNETAYIKETILNRADDVFWIFKYGQEIVPEEIKLIEKLNGKNVIPLGVLNGIDLSDVNENNPIIEYEEQLSKHVREIIGVSAKDALESLQDHDDEKWQKSQMDLLLKELEKTANNHAKRLAYITERFIHWLKRFQTELEIIQEREPYYTSYLNLKEYVENLDGMELREAAQNKHLIELTTLYKRQSIVFKQVSTLYQLIQVIEAKPFSENQDIVSFKNQAKQYLSSVREYRKLYQEYNNLYQLVDKKHQKINGMVLLKHIFGKHDGNEYFKEQIEKLNEQQQHIEKKYHVLKSEEQELLNSFKDVKKRLNQLVLNQLASISKDFSTIEFQRHSQNSKIQNAIIKLESFDNIVEAQAFIIKFVNDYVLKEEFILTKDEKNQLEHTLQVIKNVNFDYQTYINQCQQVKPLSNGEIQSMVEEKNPFCPLEMTEDDVRTQFEEPPKLVEVNNK
ncbi:dynamin family protein [Rummeliibacillus pycnus]|uniref:dynamin family protein n=1 Tax=Rummeliibacillus pycnus TaxID=101070 RepID=UPI0037CB8F46